VRIAKRLWLSAAATVAVVVLLIPVLFWNFSVYVETQSNNALVKSMHDNFFERASVRDRYFLYREDRVRLLWDESKVRSDQLLLTARSQFRDEADRKTLERIGRTIDETALMFHRVVDNTASLNSATGNRNVFEELDKRLYSQLLLKAAEIRDAIEALQDSSSRQVHQAQQRFIMLSGGLALLLTMVIVLNAVQVDRLIRRRLALLHEGASRLTHGDIKSRIVREGVDEFSEIAGAINQMIDTLTQREEAIRQASHYSRSLLEASLDPLVTISAEGKITDVNEASTKVTGITREALIGADFADYFTEPDKAREGYQQVFSKGFVTDYPLAIRHISGNITEVLYNACVYRGDQGKVLGVFAAARDVTKQREANDALEALSRALARSNTELEQFAYVASHDLQEPLRMVVGYVQLIEKRLADKLDADTREFMAFAVDGAMRMQGMIEDILVYSRVTTKAQPLARVDSAAALQEALDRLASRIKESGAEIDAQPLPSVMADRSQLVQLFQNLISNSIKFCKDRAPRVRVEAVREAGRWRFSVIDNGIGIAPEYRAQLFVIFRRLHTQREYPGTGIGLAICKRIIERHGGNIGLDSAPEGGSVFWFTLPEEHDL
jgi:PAS domain S-box-containing protein